MSVQEIISNDEIIRIHANANFGTLGKREVVNFGVLKCASGYFQGHTATQILMEHGLVTTSYKLTDKGKKYLWAAFGNSRF